MSITLPLGTIMVILAGFAGAWIAAGTIGLLAHPLRHVMTWLTLGMAIIAVWANSGWKWRIILLIGAVIAMAMTSSTLPVVNLLAVSLVLAIIGSSQSGVSKEIILSAAMAIVILGIYRLLCTSIPLVWLMADSIGGFIGWLVGCITGQSLWVGATFAGLDFLVLIIAFYLLWLFTNQSLRHRQAIYAAVAIIAGHLLYLIILAFVPKIQGLLPHSSPETNGSWVTFITTMLPWNIPALAGIIHLVITGLILRWLKCAVLSAISSSPIDKKIRLIPLIGVVISGIILVGVSTLYLKAPELKGKKIVVYEKGFLNWLKPVHGEYGHLSVGMYGLLPHYIESLGARCVISPDLSEKDIRDANALVLIYPNELWSKGQLQGIWNFVNKGGRLLILGEHTVLESDGRSRFNDVLKPIAVRVQFDSATFAVGGWLQSYQSLAHPITSGISDDRNQFGVVIGASLQIHWPAQPILVGRWGWADLGNKKNIDDMAMMGDGRYNAGERLGDLPLVAEQSIGKGKIIVFGDTSSWVNGITPGAHLFTSRLLGYLADHSTTSQGPCRGLIELLVMIGLITLLVLFRNGWSLVLVSIFISASLIFCTKLSYQVGEVLPDGRGKTHNNLAYIDSSHLEAYSEESWREDGLMGFIMTLMRNGYLTLSLPEFSSRRLEQAEVFVSIAPNREFSNSEREAIHKFIKNGGIFISMVGYENLKGSARLLSEFDFHIGNVKHFQEPLPMGHFKAPFLRKGERMAYVRFHAGWPVECNGSNANVIVYGPDELPIIVMRRFGQGKIVVIGDTGFAMNKNLEHEDGSPFDGMYENADFWRWFLTYLRDEPEWLPPHIQD